MIRVGIDCGITGAISAVDEYGKVAVYDMPSRMVKDSKTKKKEVNGRILTEILSDLNRQGCLVNVERVGPMPKQGVTSVWNFSNSYAAVKYTLEALGMQYSLITPQSWKKAMGVPAGSDKDYTRLLAQKMFPHSGFFDRKKDNGRSDSYFIAMHGKALDCAKLPVTATQMSQGKPSTR